jgi:phosphate:Na+ symporter
VKNLGQALLGFGFIFLGMKVMNDGLAPLATYELTRQVLVALAGNPFMGLLVGAVLSAGMASSAATIGLMLSVVQQGLLPLDGAIPSCSAPISAPAPPRSRRACARPPMPGAWRSRTSPSRCWASPSSSRSSIRSRPWWRRRRGCRAPGRQCAHALQRRDQRAVPPFAPWAADAIAAMVPDDAQAENPHRTRYLDDRYLDQPALAIGQATREALRMGDVAQSMLRDAMVVLRTNDQELLENVERRDDQLDHLEREIKIFLSRLGRETMSADLAQKEIALISFIGNLENIGDIIDKNLMELARKKLYQGRRFSEAGEMELIEFHSLVSKNLERAIAGFAANDRSLAQEVLDQRPVVRQRERELRESHLGRLRRGLAESLETSEIHLDVLTNLKRISSHVTALVFPILEEV